MGRPVVGELDFGCLARLCSFPNRSCSWFSAFEVATAGAEWIQGLRSRYSNMRRPEAHLTRELQFRCSGRLRRQATWRSREVRGFGSEEGMQDPLTLDGLFPNRQDWRPCKAVGSQGHRNTETSGTGRAACSLVRAAALQSRLVLVSV